MKKLLNNVGIIVVMAIAACSPKQFSKVQKYPNCESPTSSGCLNANGFLQYNLNETVAGGKLDILIVDDNSASMSTEQNQLANKFNNFINNLENKKIDYRIAVTTTDISNSSNMPRQVNQNGSLQDGRLVTFGNGEKFLTNSSGNLSQKDTLFKNAVKRSETLSCESFIIGWVNAGKSLDTPEYSSAYYANCPSGDERGIYAANLTVKNNYNSFIRPEANLAVITLADEDVRSQLYWYSTPGFLLENLDSASSFMSTMANTFPTKKFSFHSIITKDPSCLNIQNNQTLGVVHGSYGNEYANLSNQTGGIVGDICAADYTVQLNQIFDNVQGQIVDKVALPCSNPHSINLSVTLNGNPVPGITWSVVGAEVQFSDKLPYGTIVTGQVQCQQP